MPSEVRKPIGSKSIDQQDGEDGSENPEGADENVAPGTETASTAETIPATGHSATIVAVAATAAAPDNVAKASNDDGSIPATGNSASITAAAAAAAPENVAKASNDDGDGDVSQSNADIKRRYRPVPMFLSGILKCTCPKTTCLKLYCECLSTGKYCNDECICNDCKNRSEFGGTKGIRTMAIKDILQRRHVKDPKIAEKFDDETIKAAVPGCLCTKDNCLKKYCFCFRSAVKCSSDNCICKDCSNAEEAIKPAKKTPVKKAATPKKVPKSTLTFPKSSAAMSFLKARVEDDVKKITENLLASGCLPEKVAILPPINTSTIDGDSKKSANGAKNAPKKPPSTPHHIPVAIPFSAAEFPELTIDETQDYSKYVTSFKRPLFSEPSRPLEIAYSHRQEMKILRQRARQKKDDIRAEYEELREKLIEKKLEISLANDVVKEYTQKAGAWTKKVFDLELKEPCTWNTNLENLKEYIQNNNGRLPPNYKKATTEDEKSLALWLDRIRLRAKGAEQDKAYEAWAAKEKGEGSGKRKEEESDGSADSDDDIKEPVKKKRKRYQHKIKKSVLDYPHRLQMLDDLGVVWGNQNENKWETMFQKLVQYKEEHGTTRFPSDEQCAASGDEELIALQKWVKSQVLNFRYGKSKGKGNNPDNVKRFLDIGFSFEKWYAKPGNVRKMNGRDIPKFDEIAQDILDKAGKTTKKEIDEKKDNSVAEASVSNQEEGVPMGVGGGKSGELDDSLLV